MKIPGAGIVDPSAKPSPILAPDSVGRDCLPIKSCYFPLYEENKKVSISRDGGVAVQIGLLLNAR
jgi:hypothetical protein